MLDEEGVPPEPKAWGECPCVLVATLEEVHEGPTARSMPPIFHHTLTLKVAEVLRGELPPGIAVGGALTCSNSARQMEPPVFPAAGTACIVGAVAEAARGMMMRMPMRGGPEPATMNCLRLEERTDESHAAAVLGCSLPFGWSTAADGAVLSPWASLGSDCWAPGEGSTIKPEDGAHTCSITGRPVLSCGASGLTLTGCMVPPASAADPTGPSKGGKPKGKFPGGWFEWGNPDGDGEYRLKLTNTSANPLTIPALVRVGEGGTPSWAASLLIECCGKCYHMPTEGGATDAGVRGPIHATVLAPGDALEIVVNVLRLDAPEIPWPRGGSRLEFTFWLGELSCGPFSLYYKSDHHDVLRKRMGIAVDNYQGVELTSEPEPEPAGSDAEGGQSRFPKHWGDPPMMQTRDLRPLPGGYGMGSGTLAKWIEEKMAADTEGTTGPSGDTSDASGKIQWPELVGADAAAAVATIKAERPELTVLTVEAGMMMTMDFDESRVRVIYSPEDGKVTDIPRCG